MSKYTTGEAAKACGVTVRTVQFYDVQKLVRPCEISEGGRRLYGEEDLKRLKTVCFLRELGISVGVIKQILNEENSADVLDLLMQREITELKKEIADRQCKLDSLKELSRWLKKVENPSVNSLADVARVMENKRKLRRVSATMLLCAIGIELIEIAAIVLGVIFDLWWLYVVGAAVAVIYGVWISIYYFKNVDYVCPACHKVFKPRFKEAFWAHHTLTTRKLTCPECGKKSFCIETYGGKK